MQVNEKQEAQRMQDALKRAGMAARQLFDITQNQGWHSIASGIVKLRKNCTVLTDGKAIDEDFNSALLLKRQNSLDTSKLKF